MQDRIGAYQKSLFAPSQQLDYSITTVAHQNTYRMPAGMQALIGIRLMMGSIWLPLERVPMETILGIDVVNPPIVTLPSLFAQYGMSFRLYATPSQAYPLELMVNNSPPAPVADTDANFWTDTGSTGAGTLILLSTCAEICRTTLNDAAKADQFSAMVERREEPSMQELTQRLAGPLRVEPYI